MQPRVQGLRLERGIELDANDDLRSTSTHGGVGSTCGTTVSQKQEQKDKADKCRKGGVGKEKNKKYVDDP